jgi:outer membrane receptor protein involved in Fe transport
LQPEWQAALGADLRVPIGRGLDLFATPTGTYRSKLFFELPNRDLISQDSVWLLNARAGVEAQNGRWRVAAFGNNILDTEYLIDAGNTGGAFGIPTFIRGLPAIYGVEVAFRF